jgi:hypothetical protein
MRLLMIAVLALASRPAFGERCQKWVLEPRALATEVTVTPDGGIVVGEERKPRSADQRDRKPWSLRYRGKPSVAAQQIQIAPGLVVLRPREGALSFELMTRDFEIEASATLADRIPAPLAAPKVRGVIASRSRVRRVSSYVTVELDEIVPKQALALVLAKADGTALSWGVAGLGAKGVSVYHDMAGCITTFPAGTKMARPGERVVAFWIDAFGRRSPVSAELVVGNL